MHRHKTLMILSPGFPQTEGDTACLPSKQIFIRELQRKYPDLKFVIIILDYPVGPDNGNWHTVQVKNFASKSHNRFLQLYKWFKVWRELKRAHQSREIVGLLSFRLDQCALIGHYFAKLHKLKHLCWVSGTDAQPDNHYFSLIKPRHDEIVAASTIIAATIKQNYGIEAVNLIPVGLDPSMFDATPRQRTIDILAAGALIPAKQYHLFIEAISRVRKKKPNVNAVLCGSGPEQERLSLMIKKLGLEENIKLTGSVPHQEVINLMSQSKVFLHTAGFDGQATAVLEALYAGAKAISFVNPFQVTFANWQIARSTMEMAGLCVDILNDPNINYQPTTSYTISNTADAFMRLLNSNIVTAVPNRPGISLNEKAFR